MNTVSIRLEENNFRAEKGSTDFHSTFNCCVEVTVPEMVKCNRVGKFRGGTALGSLEGCC